MPLKKELKISATGKLIAKKTTKRSGKGIYVCARVRA
jgi:predicted RNA-binding protein YlxR (DUF448 family)